MATKTRSKPRPKKLPRAASIRLRGKKAPKAVASAGLRRAALKHLVSISPTPAIFEDAPGQPPFDLQDK